MPTLTVDQQTYDMLVFSARLMDVPVDEVVRIMVQRLERLDEGRSRQPVRDLTSTPISVPKLERPRPPRPDQPPEPPRHPSPWLPVHKVYRGRRVDAEFNRDTMEVKVLSAPLEGRAFPSPTAAAMAVLERLPSGRETQGTNGRTFWKVTGTGEDLRSIVGRR